MYSSSVLGEISCDFMGKGFQSWSLPVNYSEADIGIT
jgi:hypothetical protein